MGKVARDEARRRQAALAEAKSRLRSISDANRAAGESQCVGFRFEKRKGCEPAENERAYLGAFLSLAVARKHPELLAVDTLYLAEVTAAEPRGARTVLGPGRVRDAGAGQPAMGCVVLIVAGALVLLFWGLR
jgi:hypothetical protein